MGRAVVQNRYFSSAQPKRFDQTHHTSDSNRQVIHQKLKIPYALRNQRFPRDSTPKKSHADKFKTIPSLRRFSNGDNPIHLESFPPYFHPLDRCQKQNLKTSSVTRYSLTSVPTLIVTSHPQFPSSHLRNHRHLRRHRDANFFVLHHAQCKLDVLVSPIKVVVDHCRQHRHSLGHL